MKRRRGRDPFELKSVAQLALMREAGLVVAQALSEMRDAVAPGVSTLELDGIARDVLSNVMLGGICQPYFCRLREDAPTAAGHPEGRLRLAGTYRYTVIDDLSRDETGDI